ncbi:uncharacterized protein MKK02DRAFT_40176 [Dioszegia hungarica]|uniref:BZIP domain-containing protein n=1 Tax=Dioszegia hungarica TaxID=4972 RepID=A0AA38HDX3_9TREE|nr:uncharacterized protein MKK02DRAFT_40176 [Dioszegia hungarica]KAI9639848.1 hypothetical protein MKK02DRAFT_40176 [Dioszegia hungarica]
MPNTADMKRLALQIQAASKERLDDQVRSLAHINPWLTTTLSSQPLSAQHQWDTATMAGIRGRYRSLSPLTDLLLTPTIHDDPLQLALYSPDLYLASSTSGTSSVTTPTVPSLAPSLLPFTYDPLGIPSSPVSTSSCSSSLVTPSFLTYATPYQSSSNIGMGIDPKLLSMEGEGILSSLLTASFTSWDAPAPLCADDMSTSFLLPSHDYYVPYNSSAPPPRASPPTAVLSATPTSSTSSLASSPTSIASRRHAHDFNVGLTIGSALPIPKRRKPKRPVVPHEWDNVRDPKERRKAQNRSAQRTFRAKARGLIVAGTCPTTIGCAAVVSTPAREIVFGIKGHHLSLRDDNSDGSSY